MPIYSYKCTECNHEFDVLCKYDEWEQTCPKCLCEDTKRQLASPNFNMKKGPYDSYL